MQTESATTPLVPGVFAVGTTTVRVEANGRTIVRVVRRGRGWAVVELSAEERARVLPLLPRESFLVLADAPAPARPAARPVELAMLPAADSAVAATGLLF